MRRLPYALELLRETRNHVLLCHEQCNEGERETGRHTRSKQQAQHMRIWTPAYTRISRSIGGFMCMQTLTHTQIRTQFHYVNICEYILISVTTLTHFSL